MNIYDVTITKQDYEILLTSQARLDDLRLIISSDPRTYGKLDTRTEEAVERLLGIERKKEETA